MNNSLKKYYPGVVIFFISLIICLATYKNRGIAWDEPTQRDSIGYVAYNYVFNNDHALLTSGAKDHGTGFEMPLIIIEKIFKLNDSRDIFLMRHLVSHIFFLISIFAGYLLIYNLFKKQSIACLGFLMLAFMPRIYAHSFINTKDIPFLSMNIISLAICYAAFAKQKKTYFFLLGVSCGYLTSIRIMGILLVLFIIFFLLLDIIYSILSKQKIKSILLNLGIFIITFCISIYSFWPILWISPFKTFIDMFGSLSHFNWIGTVLFNGIFEPTLNLPKLYIPIWIGITVPVIWLFSGIGGIVITIIAFIKKPSNFLQNTTDRNFLLYLLSFSVPVFAIIYLKSIVYDDWRHLYFIYPPFVLLALYSIDKLTKSRYRVCAYFFSALQLGLISFFMIRYYPFEMIYFNELTCKRGEYLRTHYELDYWGVSFKQGLDYLLANDHSNLIKISGEYSTYGVPLINNISLLPKTERKRLVITNSDSTADYLMTDFRWHPEDYNYPKYYDIKVLNSTILCIYDLEVLKPPPFTVKIIDFRFFDTSQSFTDQGTVVALWSKCIVAKPFALPKGKYNIIIVSKGTEVADQYPHNNLFINDNKVGDFISNVDYSDHVFRFEQKQDTPVTIKIDMDNDAVTKDKDRNTFIRDIYITKDK